MTQTQTKVSDHLRGKTMTQTQTQVSDHLRRKFSLSAVTEALCVSSVSFAREAHSGISKGEMWFSGGTVGFFGFFQNIKKKTLNKNEKCSFNGKNDRRKIGFFSEM